MANNLRTSLILHTWGVLAAEQVGMQLKALEDSVRELQHDIDVLALERDQAMEVAAKATTDAEHARAATAKFKKAAESADTQLAAERKRKEDLEAKVGGLKFEFETRSAELEARCNDLQM